MQNQRSPRAVIRATRTYSRARAHARAVALFTFSGNEREAISANRHFSRISSREVGHAEVHARAMNCRFDVKGIAN